MPYIIEHPTFQDCHYLMNSVYFLQFVVNLLWRLSVCIIAETADAEWACPDCTLLNKLSDHWCSVCERKRDTSNSETDSVVEIIPAAASNQVRNLLHLTAH